jgi:hypothetical protein
MFLLGMLSERTNHQGALFGVCVGGTLMLYYGVTQLVCPPGAGDSAAKALPEICNTEAFSWWGTRIESWWSGASPHSAAARYFAKLAKTEHCCCRY